MKSFCKYISLLLLLLLYSCAKEGELEPLGVDSNPFEVSTKATDTESMIRRKFFESTGVYLTFSDTLKYKGVQEILDFSYNLTNRDFNNRFSFSYIITENNKQSAADFVEKNIISKLLPKARPYSILLVDTIKTLKSDLDLGWVMNNKKLLTKENLRCTAFAKMEQIATMSEVEKEKLMTELLTTIIESNLLKLSDEIWADFFEISKDYYSKTIDDPSKVPNDIKDLGFLKARIFTPKKRVNFLGSTDDQHTFIIRYIKDYISKQWKVEYAEFPLVIQKFEIIDAIVNEHIILEN